MCVCVCVVQALSIISDIGDMLLAKYSRQPVPKYSEDDEDFRQRHAKYFYCVNETDLFEFFVDAYIYGRPA